MSTLLDMAPRALRFCCLGSRTQRSAEATQQLEQLSASPALDWEEVLLLARHHSVMPLLYRTLRTVSDQVPAEVLTALADDYHANAHFAMLLAQEARHLFDAFGAAGVEAVPFKGIVLAQWAYGNLTYRTAGDLDILVAPDDFEAAEAVIRSLGYVPDANPTGWRKRWYVWSQHEFPYLKPDEGFKIDLHTALSARRFAQGATASALKARSTPVQVHRAMLPCLSAPDWLYVLTMHATKHRWESLKWICDVAEVFRAHANLPVDAILAHVEQRGAGRMLRLGVLLAHGLLAAPVPVPLLRAARADVRAQALAKAVVEELSTPKNPWHSEWRRFVFHVHVRDSIEAKLRYLSGSAAWYALRGVTGARH
ncbi:MAG: hypothetical protein GVY12_16435 [Bacteroidetes bacterium]|nr:hypothetical protein [Bacteroidota bacterium]